MAHATSGRRNARGFTLVELLVVVAIIALLIAILLPSLQRAKYVTRTVVCMSNLRQVVVGMTSYSSANRGYYPAWNEYGLRDHTTDLRSTGWFWVNSKIYDKQLPPGSITELIWPEYIPDLNGIFKCPLVTDAGVMKADLHKAARTQYTMLYGVTAVNVIDKPLLHINDTFTIKGREFVTFMSDAIQGNGFHFYANHVPRDGVWGKPHFTEINWDINAYRAEYADGNFAATDGSVIQKGRGSQDPGGDLVVLNSLNLPLEHER